MYAHLPTYLETTYSLPGRPTPGDHPLSIGSPVKLPLLVRTMPRYSVAALATALRAGPPPPVDVTDEAAAQKWFAAFEPELQLPAPLDPTRHDVWKAAIRKHSKMVKQLAKDLGRGPQERGGSLDALTDWSNGSTVRTVLPVYGPNSFIPQGHWTLQNDPWWQKDARPLERWRQWEEDWKREFAEKEARKTPLDFLLEGRYFQAWMRSSERLPRCTKMRKADTPLYPPPNLHDYEEDGCGPVPPLVLEPSSIARALKDQRSRLVCDRARRQLSGFDGGTGLTLMQASFTGRTMSALGGSGATWCRKSSVRRRCASDRYRRRLLQGLLSPWRTRRTFHHRACCTTLRKSWMRQALHLTSGSNR